MNINLFSPINKLGYGVAGVNILKSLSKENDVSLFPIGPIEVDDEPSAEIVKTSLMSARFLDFDAPCIKIWHQNDMSQFVGKGLRIGFPFFELDEFTDLEKHHLNNVDYLFVCSEWAKKICIDQLSLDSNKIFVVPLGVDTETFKPKMPVKADGKTIFFNCGKWEIRKGHDVLFDIFCSSFSDDDNVELWMMTTNPFLSPEEDKEWKSLYSNSKLGDKIKFIPRAANHKEVYNIMSKVDCGIFPSRAEGWNLELLEMMACGKQVIATNVSAHTEFCNQDNSLLVNIEEKELAYDGKWFYGKEGMWASIQDSHKEQFISHMQRFHQENSTRKVYNEEGVSTAQKFSWNNTARKILEYVQILQEK